MKNLVTLIALAPFCLKAQTDCSVMNIIDLRYHAFDPTKIVVECNNTSSSEIFSYPSFVLRNTNNDSVAGETVNFFGIVGSHVTTMNTVSGFSPLPTTVEGTLELWTLFGETLACTFPINESLCPATECSDMEVGIANLGGALVLGTFNFTFTNQFGFIVSSGQLTLDPKIQMVFTNVCLSPGQYTLTVGTDDFPLMGVPTLTFNEPGLSGTVMLQANINNTTGSAVLNVPFYLPCLDGPNAVTDQSMPPRMQLSLNQGLIIVEGVEGPVQLLDLSGRILAEREAANGRAQFAPPLAGVYALREKLTNRAAKIAVAP